MVDGAILLEYAEGNYQRNTAHKYIAYTPKCLEGYLPVAGYEVCRSYGGKIKLTSEQWKHEKKTIIHNYTDINTNENKASLPFNYKLITDSIRKNGFFIPQSFNLPNNVCTWMDCATNMKVTFHKTANNDKPWISFVEGSLNEHYGENFPIKPKLQREGHLYSTFLPTLLHRIVKKRDFIIQNSNLAFNDEWIFEIKDLIIDCISLIDITLNCLYLKAEYSPHSKWKFNKEKLGSRVNRRINDKLKWVYQITGNPLNIESEREALDNFRIMRNHFNHFDPPCFVITLEEVTTILNQVMEIGMILIKIRQAIGNISSVSLINFILQKKVVFVSEKEFTTRSPHNDDGYFTSVWPPEEF